MIIPIALSFIPLLAVYLCFALLVKDFKKLIGILSCLLGLLAFIPIMGIDLIKDRIVDGSQFSQLVKFLGLALVEEGVKMVLLFFLPSKKTVQGAFFSYSVLSGLTLGCFETLLYISIIHARLRWPAILVHAICAGLSGIFVYSVKKKNVLITPFIFAVLFHGVYNYLADFLDFRNYFAYVVILIALVECKLRYEVLKADLAEKVTANNVKVNKFSKGDSKNMGFKDLLGKLFGKKDVDTDTPEQTVFGAGSSDETISASDFDGNKTEEATVVSEPKEEEISSSIVAAPVPEVKEEKASGIGFHDYPPIDKLFNEEDVPEPIKAEPKVEETPVKIEEPVIKRTRTRLSEDSAENKTVKDNETVASEKKTSTRGRKPAAAKTEDAEKKPSTRGRKPAAAKTEDAEKKPATRGRKPAAAKTEDAEKKPATRGRKPAAAKTEEAEKKPATRGRKPAAAKTEEAEKKPATRGRKPAAAKTEDAEKKPATRGRKPAAAKTADAEKKPATRGRKPAAEGTKKTTKK